jgi:LysM repeat protein
MYPLKQVQNERKQMIKKISMITMLILMLGIWVVWAAPVEADSKQPQAYYQTPTPDATGRIVYKVKKNDTCLSVSLLTGVDLNTLKQLNKLDEACSLSEGQDLLLGISQRPTLAPSATPTPGPALPTPTAFNGNGQICIYLFFDTNGNAMPEDNEPPIENGAFSIQNKDNTVNESGRTGLTPACNTVPEGDYNISVAPPEGFNPTTNMNYAIKVIAGDNHIIPFGAQPSSAVAGPTPVVPTTGDLPQPPNGNGLWLLGAGLLLILVGIGMGVYFVFISRKNRSL